MHFTFLVVIYIDFRVLQGLSTSRSIYCIVKYFIVLLLVLIINFTRYVYISNMKLFRKLAQFGNCLSSKLF